MTFCAIRIQGPFKSYFLKRRKEGLPFKMALFATVHKLIRAIFAVLTKRTGYINHMLRKYLYVATLVIAREQPFQEIA
jgi:hypothetical protein